MMDERVIKELNSETPTAFHEALLNHAKSLVDMSRSKMAQYYDRWDRFNDVYRGVRYPDKTDLESRKKHEPEKMVVPLAFAQIQTFVAFCLMLYTQKEEIVELIPLGPEDEIPASLAEAVIARDLRESHFVNKLKQFLTDIGRFSVGIFKHSWVKETTTNKPMGVVEGTSNVPLVGKATTQVKFIGNRIDNISPFRFFPDVRLPLSRFQEGEFCASEDESTITALKKMQKDGMVSGVKHIKPWTPDALSERSKNSRFFFQNAEGKSSTKGQSPGACVVTEVQIWITPKDFMLADGKPLGEEDYPILYLITYANDQTILRVEPLSYPHNEFTYEVAEFNPDMHDLINTSLSEIIDMLQMTISWFINSHITSVRRVVQNRLIIDPSGIEMEDLIQDRAYIRINMAAAGGDVRRYIQQLNVSDVTSRHVDDAMALHQILMTVTGVSENTLGQFSPGRRSAEEARTVNFNSSARLKTVGQTIYESALQPLFKKMLMNHRESLDVETYVQLRGQKASANEYQLFKVDRQQLAGNYDFAIFDLTLPSEKGYLANQVGEMLSVMMGSPEAIPMFGYDPKKLFDFMFKLRGVRHTEHLQLDPQVLQSMTNPNAQTQQPQGGAGDVAPPAAGGGIPATDQQPAMAGLPLFG